LGMRQRFDHFEHGRPVQTSHYSTGESPPIKAGHRGIIPHLETTCRRFNTSARRSTRPSAGPERSQLLRILPSLTVRQFFSVSAYFSCCANIGGRLVFSVHQYFCVRQYFCMRQGCGCANVFVCAKVFGCANAFVCAKVFGCANVFVCAKVFGCANVFVYICRRLYFCVFYLHSYSVCANNLLAQLFKVFS
jgi:hypothetical protein